MSKTETSKSRLRRGDKAMYLRNMAERARRLAQECGSQPLVEIYELHANMCEVKAAKVKRRRRSKDRAGSREMLSA
jgi:hypothetical protein